jgi:hypothetical protein
LSICEDGSIVALDNLIDKVGSSCFVDFLLARVDGEHIIEREYFIFSGIAIDILNEELFLFIIEGKAFRKICINMDGYF